MTNACIVARSFFLSLVLSVYTGSVLCQDKRDEKFSVGMFGTYFLTVDELGCTGIPASTAMLGGFNSSTLNVLAQDGFDVWQTYEPSSYTSYNRMRRILDLTEANRMKVLVGNGHFFKPDIDASGFFSGTGTNIYDACGFDFSDCNHPEVYNKWRPDTERILSELFAIPKYRSRVWGVHVSEESAYCHTWHSAQDCEGTSSWQFTESSTPCWNTSQSFTKCPVPVSNVDEALDYFKDRLNAAGVINGKTVVMEAWHNSIVDDCTPNAEGGFGFRPQDYIQLLNKESAEDCYFEGSYYSFPETTWMNEDYQSLNCPDPSSSDRGHYLGYLKSLDYAERHSSNVHKVIEIVGTGGGQTQPRNFHSRPAIPNANWLWFQAYASIIHGAKGIWFWGLPWAFTNEEGSKNALWGSPSMVDNRFDRVNFPSNYTRYVSNLSKELRYLANKGFLDKDSEIHSNEDRGDTFEIIRDYQLSWWGPYGQVAQFPSKWQQQGIPKDEYGIRYSVRTNGSEVIMIAANPVNASIIVDFNFLCSPNRLMREANSVDLLFHESNDASVASNDYKTNRANSVDLSAGSVLRHTTRSINGGNLQLYFGPLDVVVVKFNLSESSVAHSNGWTRAWSNGGGGEIGGWRMEPHDRYFPGDFDGDGEDELLVVGDAGSSGDWITLLKVVNGQWSWIWSNYGSPSHPLHAYSADFLVGDFDGDGRDELLGNNTWTTLFKWNGWDWTWQWSDYGSPAHQIRPFKDRMYVGDFNGDGRDDLLGCDLPSGWTTVFVFDGSSMVWGYWSDYGSNHALKPYRSRMITGDFNGDGTDEILGLNTWATLFRFDLGSWGWIWSNNGASSFNGWTYPLSSYDRVVVGNFDGDRKEELMFISTGTAASWALCQDFNSETPGWNFNWVANSTYAVPYIDDWPINDGFGFNTRYLRIRTSFGASSFDQLFATRDYCSFITEGSSIACIYDPNGANKNSDIADSRDSSLTSASLIWPNPAISGGELSVRLPIEAGLPTAAYLCDLSGREVRISLVNSGGQCQVLLPHLRSGSYILTVRTDSGYACVERLVVLDN